MPLDWRKPKECLWMKFYSKPPSVSIGLLSRAGVGSSKTSARLQVLVFWSTTFQHAPSQTGLRASQLWVAG